MLGIYYRCIRLHRFFIGNAFKSAADVTIDDETLCHQWTSVLRLKENDALIVLDGKGHEADATIRSMTKKHVTLAIGETRTMDEGTRNVTLCCAVLRRENFEWVVQKATETGVSRIIPLLTDRTVKLNLNAERLRRIAIEAIEQSGRIFLPTIDAPMTLADAVAATADTTRVFFQFGGSETWQNDFPKNTPVSCWIGPEGGWTSEEENSAKEHRSVIASLGTLTLRAETAAIVATYLAATR